MESDVEEDSKSLGESPRKSSRNSRSHEGHTSSRSQKSLSHLSVWDKDRTNPEDWTLSQSSIKSSSRKSGSRNRSQNSSWKKYGRPQERNGIEVDSDSSDHQDDGSGIIDQLSAAEEKDESVNDTSLDEASLSTSTSASKENGSSSELSVDPVVWKKFKFLTSILKETQHNLKEMDNLVFEHRRMQEMVNLDTQHAIIPSTASSVPVAEQELGDGEPKTDEAKLEEILSLLHNLTRTLSSYEQHPLLANAQQATDIPLKRTDEHCSSHLGEQSQNLKVPESQAYSSHNHDSHTYHLPEPGFSSEQTPRQLQVPHCEKQEPIQRFDKYSPRFDITRDGPLNYPDTRFNSSVPHAIPQGLNVNTNPTYTNVGILSLENEQRIPSHPYSHYPHRDVGRHTSTDDTYNAASTSNYFLKSQRRDSISQTDYAFLGPSTYEPHEASFARPSQSRPTYHNQGIPDHPLTKETRSLRKDINDIVIRKQALDSRLQSLIAHRAKQKELEVAQATRPKDKKSFRRSQSIEDDDRKLQSRVKKYRSRSKTQEDDDESHGRISSTRDCYLSMISEDQDEFPSLQMGSLENEEKISDLRNEEADLPGLGDSGLSSEINSINATIQELVRENQQLHGFLQGMTVESIAKVDQEKIELEAKIQSLSQENESLKVQVQGESDKEETETNIKKKQDGKSVSFQVSDDSVEELLRRAEMETRQDQVVDVKFLRRNTESIEDGHSFDRVQQLLMNTEEPDSGHAERIAALEAQVSELTKQNQELVQEIREGKNEVVSDKELPSDVEESSSSVSLLKNEDISNLHVTREIDKLQHKVKRLLLEKEELNIKLNREATERDFESSRLEARINILSEQNKLLSDQVNEKKSETDSEKHYSASIHSHGNISSSNNSQNLSVRNRGKTDFTSSKEASFKEDTDYSSLRKEKNAVTCETDCSSSRGNPDDHRSNTSVDSVFRRRSEYSNTESNTDKGNSKGDPQQGSSKVIGDFSITGESSKMKSETWSAYSQIDDTKTSVSGRSREHGQRSSENSEATGTQHGRFSEDEDRSTFRKTTNSSVSQQNNAKKGSTEADEYNKAKKFKRSITFDEKDEYSKADDASSMMSNTDIEHSLHTDYIDQSFSRTSFTDDAKCSGDGPKDTSNEMRHEYWQEKRDETRQSNIDKIEQFTILQPVNDPKLVSQLEELLKQNEMLIQTVNSMKTTNAASESNLESAVKQIMEDYNRLKLNIDERLAFEKKSKEIDTEMRINKLLEEKQELAQTLVEQKEKVKSLADKNKSLERKLQIIDSDSQKLPNISQGDKDDEREVLCYVKTPPTLRIAPEDKDAPYDIEVDCEIIESFSVREEVSATCEKGKMTARRIQSEHSGEAIESVQRKVISKGINVQKQTPVSASQSKSSSRKNSPTLQLSNRRGSQASISSIHNKSEGKEDQKDKQNELREGMLNLTMRKDDEKWAQALEQTEEEKEILQERIRALVNENDCLASRLEEVVGVSRNLSDQMHSARDELMKVVAEKEDLQNKVRSLEEGKEDSSISLSESFGSSRLTHRLKDRIRSLQGEVEQAMQEVHQRTIERDKIAAERESLEYTTNINLNSARKEVELLRGQLNVQQADYDRRAIELTNTKNELEKKSSDQKLLQDNFENQKKKQTEMESKLEDVEVAYRECKEKLQNEVMERKLAEERLKETMQRISAGMEIEKNRSKGDRYSQEYVSRIKNQLHQEQLRSRLLEAADQENSARILVLQRNVRETIEAYETLQAKYKQLRTAYRAKKTDKIHRRELSQQYSQQVQELGKTSAALEDNYKMMMSTLGESIGVTVEILTSHVFLSPCVVHPSPDIRLDMEAWFEAQQCRLRWLQTQLRKLCLHNWKMADIPKTTNFSIEETSKTSRTSGESSGTQRKDGSPESGYSTRKFIKRNLSDLSILDEAKSYSTSPSQKKMSISGTVSASGASSSFTSISDSDGKVIRHGSQNSNSQESGNAFVAFSLVPTKPTFSDRRQHSSNSMSLSEVGRILSDQQRELTKAKFQQYRALVSSFQRDLEFPLGSSPSVPSSMITTPEKIRELSPSTLEDEEQSEVFEVTLSESQASSSRTVSSLSHNQEYRSTEASSKSKESSGELAPISQTSGSRTGSKSFEERNTSSSPPFQQEDVFEEDESFTVKTDNGQSDSRTGTDDSNRLPTARMVKENKSVGVDVDKDHDSMEELDDEEDIIRIFVESEMVNDDLD